MEKVSYARYSWEPANQAVEKALAEGGDMAEALSDDSRAIRRTG